MLCKSFAPLAAAVAIAGLAPSARADVTYSFNFDGNATGSFTTGAAATDPGYFLVTALQVSTFIDTTLGAVSVSIDATSPGQFAPEAAYDPTTGAFLNHFGGGTNDNLGDIGNPGQGESSVGTINGQPAYISGPSFSLGSTSLTIIGTSGSPTYTALGTLVVTPSVPEASSLALLGCSAGLSGLASLIRHRRTRAAGRPGDHRKSSGSGRGSRS